MDGADDVARSVAQLRRRAEELAVLNDLGRRLAALHDTREVLDEVARQARRLLGVDVAYIMLLRADRLRIEVVDGAMGSAMRGIEFASGQGLGGQILATGRPLSSERYLADTRFPHGEGTDAAALSEQLGGILGVPLVAGDDTLGVLLAADRRPRAFGDRRGRPWRGWPPTPHWPCAPPTSSTANAQQPRSCAWPTRPCTPLNESRQRASDLRDVLNDIVIRGEGLAAVVAALERSAGLSVEVRDHHGRDPRGRTDGQGWARRPRSTCRAGTAATSWPRNGRGRRGALRLLRIGATHGRRAHGVGAVGRRGRAADPRGVRPALLSSDADDASLLRRARAIGVDLHAVTTVAVVDAEPVGSAAAPSSRPAWRPSWAGGRPPMPTRWSCSSPQVSTRSVKPSLGSSGQDGATPTTGLAAGEGGPRGVRSAHEEARQTAALLLALGRAGSAATSDELGLYRSLFGSSGRAGLTTFISSTVGPLLAYDEEHQRDLAATLEAYLQQARHHARTCAAIHIHPNTLYQRLDRVTKVLGPRWKEPDRAWSSGGPAPAPPARRPPGAEHLRPMLSILHPIPRPTENLSMAAGGACRYVEGTSPDPGARRHADLPHHRRRDPCLHRRRRGSPVVLVHGYTAPAASWALTVDALLDAGYRAIAFDRRAHGESETPAHGQRMARHGRDLGELLAHLDLEDAVVVGASMGGNTFWAYVDQFGPARLRGAVIVDQTPKMLNADGWEYGFYGYDAGQRRNPLRGRVCPTPGVAAPSTGPPRRCSASSSGSAAPPAFRDPSAPETLPLLADHARRTGATSCGGSPAPPLLAGRESQIWPCEHAEAAVAGRPWGAPSSSRMRPRHSFDQPDRFNEAAPRVPRRGRRQHLRTLALGLRRGGRAVRLATATHGDGPRRIALVHGLSTDGALWHGLTERIVADGGATVTTVDLRGHGASDRAEALHPRGVRRRPRRDTADRARPRSSGTPSAGLSSSGPSVGFSRATRSTSTPASR